MTGSVRLGFGIAALLAVGVFVVSGIGDHDSWVVRAAGANAVRCLTASPCPRLDASGAIEKSARPPLANDSRCAKPKNWAELKASSGSRTKIVVFCADGNKAYLYHMGRLTDPAGGSEQWLTCGEAGCTAETAQLERRTM